MALERFHPLVRAWFEGRFQAPTEAQSRGWAAIAERKDTLIAAPTGSGKTLAAFLASIDRLVREALGGRLEDRTEVVYVSPLKALGNDVHKNLEIPLQEIRALAERSGIDLPEIRVGVRSGDTPMPERARMVSKPPHILITTPESLYILLTARRTREILSRADTVIVDEIHAIADDKRGAHLAISLERLDALTAEANTRAVRIGLSATQNPIETIGHLLAGSGRPLPAIVDTGGRKDLDLAIEIPDDELGIVATHEMMDEAFDRIAGMVRAHRSTIVFVNTRRMVERVCHQLAERLGKDAVAAHHGSLARETRLRAERRLKAHEIACMVATASLELGIDVGEVDLVVQIGSPRSISTFVQRIGRSGHGVGRTPKGRVFAMSRDALAECAALVVATRRGLLDEVEIRDAPIDILAQQIVAAAAAGEWDEDALFDLARRAWPYKDLDREKFDAVLEMLAEGVTTDRGRSTAHIHRDRVNKKIRGRRGARLAAITSGGAIPDNANYAVIAEPEQTRVGTVDEDFAIESLAGDVFLLGNTSWRVRRVEYGTVRVEDAQGAAPNIPFWRGEAPARTDELSDVVSELRDEIGSRLERGDAADSIASWLADLASMPQGGAIQLVRYLEAGRKMLGAVPSKKTIVAERFFDESGGMQLVLHAPFGARINRAWGLSLRKRFCRSFDLELQAAATDDGIVISLGPKHSFPLETVFEFVRAHTAEKLLTQALLASPMFTARWRWNSTRALAVLRFRGGRRVPPPLLRMRTDDLLTAVFPAQTACAENLAPGDIEIPDHPLVAETVRDCLTEAMDLDGLKRLLESISCAGIRVLAVETPEPSPLSHEILNANPYAFLDDAPLEERRARAVSMRRGLPPDLASGIGALDGDVIRQVAEDVRPVVRDADELHDALLSLVLLPAAEGEAVGWRPWMDALAADRRASFARWERGAGWVAAERAACVRAAIPGVAFSPEPPVLPGFESQVAEEAAAVRIVRGCVEHSGPATAAAFAARLGLDPWAVEGALAALEGEGAVLRGSFTGPGGGEWCDRRILARIHRLTVARLRESIEPVSQADFMRFLFRWQHAAEGTQLSGTHGLSQVLAMLSGFEIAAGAWERDALPARIRDYDPDLLDGLCYSGEIVWGRRAPRAAQDANRATPLALMKRDDLPWLLGEIEADPAALSAPARDVLAHLAKAGASFPADLGRATKRLASEIEDALLELAAAGLVTADGFASVRAIVDRRAAESPASSDKFPYLRAVRAVTRRAPARRLAPSGRWSLLRSAFEPAPDLEAQGRQLLLRYGVVFRDLLAREARHEPWRELLPIFRTLEARGEIRGGRFVSGFVGEQFALPEAVDGLRAVRRQKSSADRPELIRVAATDPLNLAGITSPGARVPAQLDNAVLYKDGVPIASREAGEIHLRTELAEGAEVTRDLVYRPGPNARALA